MTTLSETIALHIEELSYADLPLTVSDKVKLSILDLLGAAMNGSKTKESEYLVKAIGKMGSCGKRGANIWGWKTKASLPMAALANGTSAHAREMDDWGCGLHPGAACIPAAAAALEFMDVSGQEFITAIVSGYEVMMRAAKAAGGDAQYELGWHPTGTCGSLGAATVVGKLIRLKHQQMAWALGLAGSFTGGTMAFLKDGAMSKRFHPGKAAETGVIAAFAAMEGFTGPQYIFEADRGGFLPTYGGGSGNANLLVEGLGRDFWIMKSGLKPYASCRDVHAALDATLHLKHKYGLSNGQIRKILVESTHEAEMLCGKKESRTVLDAQMSIPVGVALALLAGEDGLLQYSQRQLNDPMVWNLADRVNVVASPKFYGKEHCAEVCIELISGETYSHRVDISKGDPKNPMTVEEVKRKFFRLASPVLPRKQLDLIVDQVENLDQLESARNFLDLLNVDRKV